LTVRLIRPGQHRLMRWKNGGGTTAEIAIAPDGADFGTGRFDWRLSLAGIERDGPFSAFPGVDRTILLVDGAGMILTAPEGTRIALDRRFLPQDFPGEWPVDCRLLNGPVRDLNLMVNRGAMRTDWQVVALDKAATALPDSCSAAIVHLLEGAAAIEGPAARGASTALAAGDTLIAEQPASEPAIRIRGTGVLFLAALTRR
jgi:environmental stress-induced protein Ves